MAAVTAPTRVSAQHPSLLHFISQGGWSDERILSKVREMVVPEMERHGTLTYVAGILPHTTVWHSAKRRCLQRDGQVTADGQNCCAATRKVTWREGAAARLSSRFAGVPVRWPVATTGSAKPGQKNGSSLNGPRVKRSRPSIGSQLFQRTSAFIAWLNTPSYAGASSGISSSNRRLGASDFEGRGWRGFHHHGTMSIVV